MKPFLLLATRAEDKAADEEYAAFMRFGGLVDGELHRVRLEATPLPDIALDSYSGIILGGSPFNSSDAPADKSAVQHRVERELGRLLDQVIAIDFPFFGACYGVGTLGLHQGGVVDRTHGEPIGEVEIVLTDDGRKDPLLAGVPDRFQAFVGHKEACSTLPAGAVRLAGSATCPVQMFRLKSNLYATQFHPELDIDGLLTRISIYRFAGYFPPAEAARVMESVRGSVVTEPQHVLRNFVRRYRQD
ncbi:glutamine amidotransferase [Arthrobacter crystallopoietes]|uniref:GMP synthase (Glutamine-hydrolysing) n=1 Tax=Crystallibacter crystallopoietes TaxID=37928 RepID=A0A1H1G4T1_9MICC|nr:glutamine amidotransferase [Arthrobacter crystallopoietes]AUI52763.1 glutamine amidotransferase [Arthrobacter crystallopoietes]SDR08201.1 GMP synthase (glutamine-hydrolysing) [Arthrobacter crystallopoietes]